MATQFKDANGAWVVKYKDAAGTWKSRRCGKGAAATDAEAIRKIYDAEELNRRHSATVWVANADIFGALEEYRTREIPKSNTGVSRSRKAIQRNRAVINNFENWLKVRNARGFRDINIDTILGFFDDIVVRLKCALA